MKTYNCSNYIKAVFLLSRGYITNNMWVLPIVDELKIKGIRCSVIYPAEKANSVRAGKSKRAYEKGILSKEKNLRKKLFIPFNNYIMPHKIRDYHNILKFGCNYDVLSINRLSSLPIKFFLKKIKLKKIKVVFNFDDAIFLPSSEFFSFKIRNPLYSEIEKIIEMSDCTIVSSHFLASYSKRFNPNVQIVHVPVDTKIFHPSKYKKHNKITIGWQGVPANHLLNLIMIKKLLLKLSKKYSIKFKIVSYLGDQRVKNMFSTIEDVVEIDYGLPHLIPWRELPTLLSDIDIYVSPLEKTPWNEGKSALKAGIGMAMGIPVVASPVGEQKYVIKHGINGFFATSEEEWYSYLSLLIEDENLRAIVGERGRKTAEEELSLKVCGEKMFRILRRLTE